MGCYAYMHAAAITINIMRHETDLSIFYLFNRRCFAYHDMTENVSPTETAKDSQLLLAEHSNATLTIDI